jgi:hypothetical protein
MYIQEDINNEMDNICPPMNNVNNDDNDEVVCKSRDNRII